MKRPMRCELTLNVNAFALVPRFDTTPRFHINTRNMNNPDNLASHAFYEDSEEYIHRITKQYFEKCFTKSPIVVHVHTISGCLLIRPLV